MSASPVARQAHSHAQLIPAMRKVLISDASQMPDVYSSTPNGTIYSTTPNGKFKWERWREKKTSTLELVLEVKKEENFPLLLRFSVLLFIAVYIALTETAKKKTQVYILNSNERKSRKKWLDYGTVAAFCFCYKLNSFSPLTHFLLSCSCTELMW